jgi:hypothetical protein
MTRVTRNKRWLSNLKVPRSLLQDFRYYKDRLLSKSHDRILIVVEPYSDSIFYINLKKINFIEFNIVTDEFFTFKSQAIFKINRKLRLRRTHFFKLGLQDQNNIEKIPHHISYEGEYLFNHGVPLISIPQKNFFLNLQEEKRSLSYLDNLASRLKF